MKKRLCYICGSIISLVAVLDLLSEPSGYVFLQQIIPAIAIFCFYGKCEKPYHFKIMTVFSLWVVLYDFLYVVLKFFSEVDLFSVDYQVFLQFGIPFLYALWAKIRYGQNE